MPGYTNDDEKYRWSYRVNKTDFSPEVYSVGLNFVWARYTTFFRPIVPVAQSMPSTLWNSYGLNSQGKSWLQTKNYWTAWLLNVHVMLLLLARERASLSSYKFKFKKLVVRPRLVRLKELRVVTNRWLRTRTNQHIFFPRSCQNVTKW